MAMHITRLFTMPNDASSSCASRLRGSYEWLRLFYGLVLPLPSNPQLGKRLTRLLRWLRHLHQWMVLGDPGLLAAPYDG